LGRGEVRKIAGRLIEELFQREGLVRRRCLLQVEEEALDRVVDLGYDPLMGARALKRALERRLTRPIADHLAAGLPAGLTVISLCPGPDLVTVSVQELAEAERQPSSLAGLDLSDVETFLERIEAAQQRIEDSLVGLRPQRELGSGEVDSAHVRYFALRQQATQVREQLRQLRDQRAASRRPSVGSSAVARRSSRGLKHLVIKNWASRTDPLLRHLAQTEDLRSHVRELTAAAVPATEKADARLIELLHHTALLHTLEEACSQPGPEQVLLWLLARREAAQSWLAILARRLAETFDEPLGLESKRIRLSERPLEEAVLVRGPHVHKLLEAEQGTHLFFLAHQSLVPIQVHLLSMPSDTDPEHVLTEARDQRRGWLEQVGRGEAAAEDDPCRLGPMVRIYDEGGRTLDLRTGLVVETMPDARDWQAFVLTRLPLPPELFPDRGTK
jgi:ATP-dependent Clp protease ATP-binding subunit ClpC